MKCRFYILTISETVPLFIGISNLVQYLVGVDCSLL